jgi:hypothetical protein
MNVYTNPRKEKTSALSHSRAAGKPRGELLDELLGRALETVVAAPGHLDDGPLPARGGEGEGEADFAGAEGYGERGEGYGRWTGWGSAG